LGFWFISTAMNQAGGNISTQADLRTVRKSTTERKSMSTKTTIKRIALVAVSALGFGMVSAVAPANATYPTTVTLGDASALSAAVTGQSVRIKVPLTFTTAASTDSITVSGVLTAKPSTSSLDLNNTGPIDAVAVSSATQVTTTTTFVTTASNNQATTALGAAAVTSAAPWTQNLYFDWTPDKAGTYNIAFFIDGSSAVVNPTGLIKSGDPQIKYFSITVADQPATTATLSQPVAGTGATYDSTYRSNGIWVKVGVTNGSSATRIDAGQQVLVTIPSGLTLRRIAGETIATTGLTATNTTYALSTGDFDKAGYAYLNFTADTAASYTVKASVSGQTAAAAELALAFKAPNKYATAGASATLNDGSSTATPDVGTSTGSLQSASSIYVNPSTAGNTFIVFAAAADISTSSTTNYVGVELVDTNKYAHGNRVALTADYAVALATADGDDDATDGTAGKAYGTFTVPNKLPVSSTSTENAYTIYVQDGASTAIASSAISTVVNPQASSATNTYASVTQKPAASLRVVNGGSVTLEATYVDQYGNAKVGLAVSARITAGRNLQADSTNLVTDANGKVSFTVTDAAPTSTTLTDTVTFTGGATTSFTITYVSALTASTLTTSPSATTADTAAKALDLGAVAVSGTASDGADSITATAKDANGIAIAGLPVTLTLPAGVTLKSTSTLVAYTNSSGVASWSVYASKAGTYAFTFTGGGLTKTSYGKWTAGTARVVSVTAGTAANGVTPVTIKVSDAHGNGVASTAVSLTAKDGYFQGLPMTSSQNTDANGEIVVAFVGGGSVTAAISGGQSLDLAGYVGTTAAAGYPAGVATATATVDAASGTTSDALDAANEATDAANAATDAANAAAEAADAATAAAQDAQAAVAELATKVASLIAGIKAQITTLTNLVIKIQKKVKA